MNARPAIVLTLLAIVLACAPGPDVCRICEREIHPEVRATITLVGGRRVHACCPRCALHHRRESGRETEPIAVTDHAGGGPLPIERAFLVEGSDETPCLRHHPPPLDEARTPLHLCYDRCMPSLIAFRTADSARTFIEDHGGTLRLPGDLPDVSPAAR